MSVPWDQDRLVEALARLGGADISVFIWGNDDEPEGDIYLASDEFVELLSAEYEKVPA